MDDKFKDRRRKTSKTPAELLSERAKRIKDAYELRVPDRVPVCLNFGYMLARLGGIINQELEGDLDVGRDGGFIMGPNISMAEADLGRVKVWVDATRVYGVY